MSFHWQIESKPRRVTITAEGDFTRADVESYLKAVDAGGAVTWSKLFDGRFSRPAMSREDMLALGVLFRSYHVQGPVGPLAVVVADSQVERVDRLLGILATADRPMRVFRDLEPARRWIERLPAQ
jgi:hypothetical protein